MLSSHEDTGSWSASYRFLRDIAGKKPKFRMADGAPEITKAGEEVVISVYMNIINLQYSILRFLEIMVLA